MSASAAAETKEQASSPQSGQKEREAQRILDARRRRRRIRERLGSFDLLPLLELLRAEMGAEGEALRFASNPSNVSQSRLIHDLEALRESGKTKVTLNLGLLSGQSLLPSYFFHKVDSGQVDARAFAAFIGFFDHAVLERFVGAIYPELDRTLFPDPERTRRQNVGMLNLKSPVALRWLFAQVFPELELKVEKSRVARGLSTSAIRLGTSTLGGDATFGERSRVPVPGIRVTLFCDTERAGSGKPWPQEISERCKEVIAPLLRNASLAMELFLVIRAQESFAKLGAGSYLGYDPVRGGTNAHRRIQLTAPTEDAAP